MNDPLNMSAYEIADAVRGGVCSAMEIANVVCERIEASEASIHALLHYRREEVLARAREIDAGPKFGRLAGVPVAVKDNLHLAGTPLTCASRILNGYISFHDATCVARLRAEGALFIGKTNLDEFAMGSSCEHSAFGPTFNPWDISRVPGGSSGGSAAAVAARYCPLALGSDTGGSIRQPAALTGTVGVKPTYGRVSRNGLVAFGSSLDQVGPFARNVADAALCLEVMAGVDPLDATTLSSPTPRLSEGLDGLAAQGLRVGYVPRHLGEGCDPAVAGAVRAALDALREAGAEIVELAMPLADYGVHVYYLVATSEASSNLSRFDGVRYGLREEADKLFDLYARTRGAGFGAEVRRRIMLGAFALSAGYQDAYYKRALKVRELARREYRSCFERCDLIVGPTSPTTAFKVGENTSDPLKMYLCDVYTIGANLAGIPAANIPCGFDGSGLPIGLHLQGPHGADTALLRGARLCEKLVNFDAARRPML